MVIIVAVALFLIASDFDLFGSVSLALYSSVFLLLGLYTLYFGRYWGKSNNTWQGSPVFFNLAMIAILATAPSIIPSANPSGLGDNFGTSSGYFS
jgi:hypothetical protein